MGGDSKSHVWNVRVTLSEINTLEKIQAFCKEHLYVKLACKESADALVSRDHVHIACVSLDKQLVRSTVKGHLSKHLDVQGNEDYSMTTPKEQPLKGLYSYICKGLSPEQPPEIIHNMLNIIDVEEHQANYWKIHKELEDKAKANYKKAEMDGRKVKKAVIAKLAEKYQGKASETGTLSDIAKDVVCEYKGDVNDTTLFTALQSVSWHIDKENTEQRAANRMLARLMGRIYSNSYV